MTYPVHKKYTYNFKKVQKKYIFAFIWKYAYILQIKKVHAIFDVSYVGINGQGSTVNVEPSQVN
jgi:hypothetical protein